MPEYIYTYDVGARNIIVTEPGSTTVLELDIRVLFVDVAGSCLTRPQCHKA